MHPPRRRVGLRLGAIIGIALISTTGCAAATSSTAPAPSSRDAQPGAPAGQTRTDAQGIEQVWVPAGSFEMGTDAAAIAELEAADAPDWVAREFPFEQPAHTVTLSNGFWIDRTEVTNEAFDAFVADGGYTTDAYWSEDGLAWRAATNVADLPTDCAGHVPDEPRVCVTWYEAEAYSRWRSGRLPTEAEWEYAARGPESSTYPWGDDFDPQVANVVDSTAPKPVGAYPTGASWVGAVDMAGNAMEWVADWLGPGYYKASPPQDPTGPASGSVKVEKGGWWDSNEFVARSAYRHYEDPPDYADHHIGFRVVSN